jgi:hypothetical protein
LRQTRARQRLGLSAACQSGGWGDDLIGCVIQNKYI